MASANDFKALEAGYYLNEDVSTDSNADKLAIGDPRTKETTAPEEPQQPTSTSKFNKMASLRYLFMTLALLSVFIVSLSSAAAVRPKDCHGQTAEEIKFQELLATVSDEALHEVLEEHISSKYKPGVWREGRTAMSAVHKDDAAQATSLVQLARRQNVSMTTEAETATPTISTVVVPPTSTPEPEPTISADPEPTTSETPDEPTTTPEPIPTPTPEPTTEPSSEPTPDPTVSDISTIIPLVTSTEATPEPTEAETSITEAETESSAQTTEPPVSTETEAPQTTESSGSVETTSEVESSTDAPETTQTSAEATAAPTSPSESVTPTSEPETTVTSTEAEETSTTVQTTTRSSSSMVTSRATTARSTTSNAEESSTTSEEEQSSTTQEVVFTTIRPDGSRSTITSYTIVPAAEATQEGPADPTFTPEVQDAAASLSSAVLLCIVVAGLTAMIAL